MYKRQRIGDGGIFVGQVGVVGTGIQDAEGEARLREVHGHRLHDGLGGVGKINGDDVAHAGSHLVHQAAGLAKVDILCPLACLLYTSDAADEEDSVDLGGCRSLKKKKQISKRKENKKKR